MWHGFLMPHLSRNIKTSDTSLYTYNHPETETGSEELFTVVTIKYRIFKTHLTRTLQDLYEKKLKILLKDRGRFTVKWKKKKKTSLVPGLFTYTVIC